MKKIKKFFVTSLGMSATRWLCFALRTRKDVFVCHGKHPLDSIINGSFNNEKEFDDLQAKGITNQRRLFGDINKEFYAKVSIKQIFETYKKIMPEAIAYGNVHAFTTVPLMNKINSDKKIKNIKVANIIRHPINYIDSHFAQVKSTTYEQFPNIYRHYNDNMFPNIIKRFPKIKQMKGDSDHEHMSFAVSCSGIDNMYNFIFPQIPTVQMEKLTTEVSILKNFCEYLTQVKYSQNKLSQLIQQGPINRHKKKSSPSDPNKIYDSWEQWQKDIFHHMVSDSVINKFIEYGYQIPKWKSINQTK